MEEEEERERENDRKGGGGGNGGGGERGGQDGGQEAEGRKEKNEGRKEREDGVDSTEVGGEQEVEEDRKQELANATRDVCEGVPAEDTEECGDQSKKEEGAEQRL